ncbi:MAG: hypothetical protein ACMG6S_22890 [Byssovorax sp.]
MRLFSCLIVVSVPAMLAIGCLTVDADECWVNTSGGLGGSKPIPIGAGVGATTGGDHAEPPRGPLDNGGAPHNPCTAPSVDPEFGKPATRYIDCKKRGLSPFDCSQECGAVGAACGSIASHPYKSGAGTGQLTWCKNGEPTFTCTYTFPNGDGCALTLTPLVSFWICSYPGG